ncbi:MAG TPA: response regulator transcription factor [Terriglobales bacterium]|nr:response regulator transcription factor [Terriglobales bacterium]
MSRILIVEDELHLAQGLRYNLEAEGYSVELAANGEAALARLGDAAAPPLDLMVLDVMLPGQDGFAVAAELRAQRRFLPILMLTARGAAEDVLRGFAAGADDYLAKPFELAILVARIRGLLRRGHWRAPAGEVQAAGAEPGPEVYDFQGRHVDFTNLELRVGERTLPLTLMEANVLRFLIQHQGMAVSRKLLLEQVGGLSEDTDTRAIDNFVVRLRRYIEEVPARPRYLLTVRGVGYKFVSGA